MTNSAVIEQIKNQIGDEDSTLRKDIAKAVLSHRDSMRATYAILGLVTTYAQEQDVKMNINDPSLNMISRVSNDIFYNIATTPVSPNVKPDGAKSPKFIADKVLLTIANTLQEELIESAAE